MTKCFVSYPTCSDVRKIPARIFHASFQTSRIISKYLYSGKSKISFAMNCLSRKRGFNLSRSEFFSTFLQSIKIVGKKFIHVPTISRDSRLFQYFGTQMVQRCIYRNMFIFYIVYTINEFSLLITMKCIIPNRDDSPKLIKK